MKPLYDIFQEYANLKECLPYLDCLMAHVDHDKLQIALASKSHDVTASQLIRVVKDAAMQYDAVIRQFITTTQVEWPPKANKS